jgi:hypothetical protein
VWLKTTAPSTLLWLQITMPPVGTGITINVNPEPFAPWGVVAIMQSVSGPPPLPCFGAETVVLMADGSRRLVGALATGDRVVAVAPDGSTHTDTVDVLLRRHLQDPKAISACRPALHTLAPGVRVTSEHLVLVREGSALAARLMKAGPVHAAPVHVDGFLPFLAGDSTVQATTGLMGEHTDVYHLALREHPDWALVVGGTPAEPGAADRAGSLGDPGDLGDLLAEGYRTPADVAVANGTFTRVQRAV